jgi:hypothetical protein
LVITTPDPAQDAGTNSLAVTDGKLDSDKPVSVVFRGLDDSRKIVEHDSIAEAKCRYA